MNSSVTRGTELNSVPGYLELLRKAVLVEGSQAAVAAKLKYSPATISRVLSGNYDGDMAAVFSAIATTYGGKTMEQKRVVPDGCMENAVGHFVPIESIEAIDLARDQFVKGVIAKTKELASQVEAFKRQLEADIQAFIDLSAEKYNVKAGAVSAKLVPLMTFDGRYKVTREIADQIDFNERLQIAKQLADECLEEWGETADYKVRAVLADSFQVNKKGRINVKKVLGLRKFNFEEPKWKQAMAAIADAVTVVGTKPYYRMHERDDDGNYNQIKIDFSRF